MVAFKSGIVAADTVAELQGVIEVLTAFTGGILFEIDRDGHYLRVWTGDPHLLVRPPQDLIGRTVEEVLGVEHGRRFHVAFKDVIDTGLPTAFEYTLDVQAGRRTFSCEVRPHDRHDGSAITATLLVRDVTSAKSLEAKLVQAERLAALGLLAASVGHEIRQPLAYVLSSAKVLERELASTALSAEARASLESIRSGAERITEIAAGLDLLAAQRRRKTATVDIGRSLQAALDLCSSALATIEVERSIATDCHVRGDEGELCQVFANLLLNAAYACAARPGAGSRRITVRAARAERDGDQVRIAVADTGVGIAADMLSRIFDPFFTTKEGDGGSGLGLYITRNIVEAHGGEIAVTSEPDRGTTVAVTLPRVASPPSTSPPSRSSLRTSRVVPASPRNEPTTGVRPALGAPRRLTLLVVDDEPRFLESLRLALAEAHDVHCADKARDALELIEEDPQRYDVVICDLAMPDIDGAAFYERLTDLGIADRFVLMTGGAYTPRTSAFISRGVCPTISKPFLLERLLVILDQVTLGRSVS